MSRLEKLLWLAEIAEESINAADPDKRSPLIGQLRAILVEIDELDTADGGEERNGLIDFQTALAERQQSTTKNPRRTTR